MSAWLLRRLLLCVPTLLGLTLVTFALSRLAPGSPLSHLLDPEAAAKIAPEDLARTRALLGLDRPLPEQYWDWLRRFATLDFGVSYTGGGVPVATRVGAALRVSFFLQLAGVVGMLGLGIPLGIWCAAREGTGRERFVGTLLFLLHCTPILLLGTLLMALFCTGPLGSLPLLGLRTPGAPTGGWAGALDVLRHSLLPCACILLAGVPGIARFTRAGLLDVLGRPWMVAAAARGFSERRRLFGHALRVGILPVVTLLGQLVPFLVAGSVTVEWLFGIPGMGQLAADAILERDYPTVMAISVLVGVAAMVGFLLADILYALLDRRVRVA